MASALSTVKFLASNLVQAWDHDPGATTALVTTPDGGTTQRWVDMRDYGGLAVLVTPQVLAGSGVTKVEIVAASDAAGTNITVVKDSGTVAADAIGDYVLQECTAEEIRQLDTGAVGLRYAAARITCQNAGDEAKVVYIAFDARFAQSGKSATTIS